MKTVAEMKLMNSGDKEEALVAVTSVEIRQTAKKTDFLSCTLVDKTGGIKAKIWDWSGEAPDSSTIWRVYVEASPFKGMPQVVIRKWEEVDNSKVDKGLFLETLSADEFRYYTDELNALIARISDTGLKTFVKKALKMYPDFMAAPGGQSIHHARLGGLLEHSVQVTKNALALAEAYKATPKWKLINKDLLIVGGILHDLGKVYDYTTESNTIEYDIAITLTGQHGVNPALLMDVWRQTNEAISWETLLGLLHLQLSHHGQEHALVTPATFSAWLLHAADISDAKSDAISGYIDGENLVSKERCWAIRSPVIDETKL